MTPKASEYVDRERQNIVSCEHENTLKSMEFRTLWTLIWHVTVVDKVKCSRVCYHATALNLFRFCVLDNLIFMYMSTMM